MPKHGCLICRKIWIAGLLVSLAMAPFTVAAGLADPIPGVIPKGPLVIELEIAAQGLTSPNVLTSARDGTDRLFIAEQDGFVRLIKNDNLLPTPYLDLSSSLVSLGVFGTQNENDFDERGLIGLAFHPDFETAARPGHGKFYTYTSEPVSGIGDLTVTLPEGRSFDHQSVIREWTADDTLADIFTGQSREVFRVDQPQFNHDGGALAFGADGYLYVGLGDGGGADDQEGQDFFGQPLVGHGPNGNGQNTETALGSVLRVDPLHPTLTSGSANGASANGAYRVPNDNPFASDVGVDEIFAYGFRNPFRFGFDVNPATGLVDGAYTGQLVLGDVGQNDIEEVNIVTLGGNFGWRLKEGSFAFDPAGTEPIEGNPEAGNGFVTNETTGLPPALIDPVAQYDHRAGGTGLAEGLSVIGGFIYRGQAIPELNGKYVFGDFAQAFDSFNPTGRLFYADLNTSEVRELVIGLADRDLGIFVNGIGQDAQGELYVLGGAAFGPFGDGGVALKLISVPEPGAATLLVFVTGTLLAIRREQRS